MKGACTLLESRHLLLMHNNTPPRRINAHHLRALVEIVESDGYVCNIADHDAGDLVGLSVMVAARTWLCKHQKTLDEPDNQDQLIDAILEIARDAGELLGIAAIQESMSAESLRAIQRVSVLTLDNLGAFKARPAIEEDPF
jgi:hypothetical protein